VPAEPGIVLHFSEDPGITRFVPHVAPTALDATPYVWAVAPSRAPDYWFPRDCPRAMAWVEPTTTEPDRLAVLGPGAHRVHLVEYSWLSRLQSVRLYVYRFDAASFRPHGQEANPAALVSDHPVRPLGPAEPVPDLLGLHERAGIELRLVSSLWPWWRAVTASTLGFSGIRLRNATPERGPADRTPGQCPTIASRSTPGTSP
jgi:hypothetical protein